MRFSVYIPVWNGAQWLPGAIESLLAQTYGDWELVIGDNASTDDAAAVVGAYRDPRIRYHSWSTFAEISENYNRTLLLCQGEWVQVLGADDRLHPTCLERMSERIDLAQREDVPLVMVVTACRRVDPEGLSAEREWYRHGRIATFRDGFLRGPEWLTAVAAPGSMPWNTGSIAMLRERLNEIGGLYRPEIGVCADLELALRLTAYGDVAYVDEALLDFTVHGASDGLGRIRRNLENHDPFGPMGIALVEGLRVHEMRRDVVRAERHAVFGAVARELLGRAILHRHHPGGRGRIAAAADFLRAVRWSPRTVLEPKQLGKSAAALLAPRRLILRTLAGLESHRREADRSPGTTASAR